jgi:hypothetical protein
MTMLRFQRLSGYPPPEREMLDIADDGTFTLWRSMGPVVGRFGGKVPDRDELAALVAAVEGSDPPEPGELPADAATETVETDGGTATVEAGEAVDGPWGDLFAAGRKLADELRDQPVAAIAIEVDASDGVVRLTQRGDGVLPLELDRARVSARAWKDGRQAGGGTTDELGLGRVEAGPGWSTSIDLPDTDAPSGARLTVEASFVADDEGIYVPVVASARATLD